MASPKGFVLHEGISPFDGQDIVSIATCHSSNRKTGDMVQVWILPKDINPLDAVKQGLDTCICGHCPHRGTGTKRTCYVNVGQAPVNIWKTYKKGVYPQITSYQDVFEDRVVRFGAYGDPSFIPDGVVANRNPRWANVLRILTLFGLRPIEMQYLSPNTREDGSLGLWCRYEKTCGGRQTAQ